MLLSIILDSRPPVGLGSLHPWTQPSQIYFPHHAKKRWLITALELPEVNKPQARISGVLYNTMLQYIQTPAIEVTSVRCTYDLDLCQIEFKNNLVLGSHCTILQVCMEGALDALAVPSDEHTALSEMVV
jgi:hypothetical protein